MFAEVIIPLALPKNYTWKVPVHLLDKVRPGCRVEVVFGKKKKYAGLVKSLHVEGPKHFEPKDIINVLDEEPIVLENQLKLWEWIASYYMCSEGEVMAAALPAHFRLNSETILVYNEESGDDFSELEDEEYLVAEALLLKKELKISEVQDILDNLRIYPVINRLIDKKICYVWEALVEAYKPRKETFVFLHPQYRNEQQLEALLNGLSRAPKQLELLLAYLHFQKTQGEVLKTDLLKRTGATHSQLKGLIDKGILVAEKMAVDRIHYLPGKQDAEVKLNDKQEEALASIKQQFEENNTVLLHGVTSSGKTLIYIKLISEYIAAGKQALVLLPEIALTAQIIRRLQEYFGGYVGVYHSKFNQNERIEIWNKVKNNELKVILGARSSLFLPFSNLGLIVVDEEHDGSFKQQDPAPRYQARDTAIYYAGICGAKVLLGTATPSIDSYYNYQNGKYGYYELTERYGGIEMPEITLVDTRKMIGEDMNRILISPALKEEIEKTLKADKQVILFQNRRGYSPFQICKSCGWIPRCRYCDVTLNYHKNTNKLHCHYCGTVYPPLHTCLACGSDDFVRKNFGTEKIEEQLQELFPDYTVARMDVDSIRGKHAHDQLIRQFEDRRIQILVGTQMVVKGLDFEHVQLVGILDADSLLGFADFRVNERAYQMMEQVSGRAGRKGEKGKVLIQVANGNHPVLQFLLRHDYKGFYEFEIAGRKKFFYPPFSRIIQLVFRHRDKATVQGAASWFAEEMRKKNFDNRYIIGPAEPIINKIRNQYLMEIIFKLPKDGKIINSCKKAIREEVANMHQIQRFKGVVVVPEVDK